MGPVRGYIPTHRKKRDGWGTRFEVYPPEDNSNGKGEIQGSLHSAALRSRWRAVEAGETSRVDVRFR
jgi:hypothetical protein